MCFVRMCRRYACRHTLAAQRYRLRRYALAVFQGHCPIYGAHARGGSGVCAEPARTGEPPVLAGEHIAAQGEASP
ncbi:MAG: hypothetical protein IJ268_08845, partial [Proteobacteria bacterium]|nr:hypothetical protein [Pseudomonadota bacterium]